MRVYGCHSGGFPGLEPPLWARTKSSSITVTPFWQTWAELLTCNNTFLCNRRCRVNAWLTNQLLSGNRVAAYWKGSSLMRQLHLNKIKKKYKFLTSIDRKMQFTESERTIRYEAKHLKYKYCLFQKKESRETYFAGRSLVSNILTFRAFCPTK